MKVKVQLLLANSYGFRSYKLTEEETREWFSVRVADVKAFTLSHEFYLEIEPQYAVKSHLKDIAESVFDLTNNPNCQEEREAIYGRGRSLSTDDVVEITLGEDVYRVACLSTGWMVL